MSDSDNEKKVSHDANNYQSPPATQEEDGGHHGPSADAPDGGLLAWSQVIGAWMLLLNTTFGVYVNFYEAGTLFRASSSEISWIGAIQSFVLLVVGALSGPIFDRGHVRLLLIFGSFCIVFGHMMLSLCTTFWQALLAQGFVIGIGTGCLFVPAVAIMPAWFSSNLGLALGLTASGSSIGGIIYPVVFYKLIDRIGFGWTVRVLGFISLATLLIPIFVMKLRGKPAKPRSIIDWTAFTDFEFMLFNIALTIAFCGLFIALFYISYYGRATGITNDSLSFYLVPILNAGSVVGRTLPNALSDKIGPLNVIAPGCICLGICILCLIAVKNVAGLVVLTVLIGLFSGVLIALPPVIFIMLTPDPSKIGTRLGMGFALLGLGVLAGGPGGGGVLGTNLADLNWTGLWVFGGVSILVPAVMFLVLRVIRTGPKLMVKT